MIGASAGGIEALTRVLSGLPKALKAALFAVVHIPAYYTSNLPRVLNSNCNGCMHATHPAAGQKIQYGHVYVAPPDYHLLVEGDQIQLWRGPKENRFRPSINALFRSAAISYRDRVIGVVLSGMLDDGSTGLWWVKHFGGLAVVQDPDDAQFKDMPRNALEHVRADYVVPVAEMGPLLAQVVQGMRPAVNEGYAEWNKSN